MDPDYSNTKLLNQLIPSSANEYNSSIVLNQTIFLKFNEMYTKAMSLYSNEINIIRFIVTMKYIFVVYTSHKC